MTTLFLDIETTGIPICSYGKLPRYTDLPKYANARAVQISWIVVKDQHILQDTNCIIKPNGFKIANTMIHGITPEKAVRGMDIKQALNFFAEDCKDATKIVCHNVDFDLGILCSEFYREKMPVNNIERLTTFCTMKQSSSNPNQRWPKLGALYHQFFQDRFPEHNAIEDAYACLRCYYKLTKNEDWRDQIELAREEMK